mmetsp:Transcript_27420/g.69735  ORF Transcript_27420/g.69735 Transcript_27420/m.69735 type:complete len:102 (-) Transcript_27420:930-1235(-)
MPMPATLQQAVMGLSQHQVSQSTQRQTQQKAVQQEVGPQRTRPLVSAGRVLTASHVAADAAVAGLLLLLLQRALQKHAQLLPQARVKVWAVRQGWVWKQHL